MLLLPLLVRTQAERAMIHSLALGSGAEAERDAGAVTERCCYLGSLFSTCGASGTGLAGCRLSVCVPPTFMRCSLIFNGVVQEVGPLGGRRS